MPKHLSLWPKVAAILYIFVESLLYPPNVRIPEVVIHARESGTVRPTVAPAKRRSRLLVSGGSV